jgi:hypothetical protein
LCFEARLAHEQDRVVGLKLTDALLGGDVVRDRAVEVLLERLALAPRRGNCGLDRLADHEAVATGLSDAACNENRPIFGDPNADGWLNQDTVGKAILDELLSVGEGEPGQAHSPGQRQQDAAAAVDDELSGELGLVVHDNGETIARSQAVIGRRRHGINSARRGLRVARRFRRLGGEIHRRECSHGDRENHRERPFDADGLGPIVIQA